MAFCYAKNWDTTKAPDFESDIVRALQAVLPILTVRKYTGPLKFMQYIPVWFGMKSSSPVLRASFMLRGVGIRPAARVVTDTFFPHR